MEYCFMQRFAPGYIYCATPGGQGYGMVWLPYGIGSGWRAAPSLPVFRAGVRGQLAVTLGCCPPGFWGGGGEGAVAALSPSTCPSPRAPASCAAPVPVVPVLCVPVLPKP